VKIALALRRFAPDGGTGRYAAALARSLLDAGCEVHVICMQSQLEPAVADRLGRSLHVHRLRIPRLGSVVTMQAFAARARGEVRRLGPTVSLALGRIPGLDVFRAGGGCHAAFLDTLPGWRLSLRHQLELRLDRSAARTARRVVANAPLPAQQLCRRYRLAAERVEVIPNGVDAARFRPDPAARELLRGELQVEPGQALVLFLGSGFARKGLTTAIEASAQRAGAVLVAVGADRGVARYRRLAERLGLRLVLAGARPDPERFLAAADLMLLPTLYDSAANSVLEAMAAGVVPLTSQANGAAAFVPEPWMAVERPDDAASFARAMHRALAQPELGRACRERALQMSWQESCGRMQRLLQEVAGETRQERGGAL